MQSIHDRGRPLVDSFTPSSEGRSESTSFEASPGQDVQPAFFQWRSPSPQWYSNTDALFDPVIYQVGDDWDTFLGARSGSQNHQAEDTSQGVDKQAYGSSSRPEGGLSQQQWTSASEGPRDLEFPSDFYELHTNATSPFSAKAPTTANTDVAGNPPVVAMPAIQYTRRLLHDDLQASLTTRATLPPPAPPGKARIDRQPSAYGALVRSKGRKAQGPFYCQIPECHKFCKRSSDLERHEQTVHALAGEHYHCNHSDCNHQTRRLDRLKAHCKGVHKDVKGQEEIETVNDEEARRDGCLFAACEDFGAGLEVQRPAGRRGGKRKRRDASCPTCHSKSGRNRS